MPDSLRKYKNCFVRIQQQWWRDAKPKVLINFILNSTLNVLDMKLHQFIVIKEHSKAIKLMGRPQMTSNILWWGSVAFWRSISWWFRDIKTLKCQTLHLILSVRSYWILNVINKWPQNVCDKKIVINHRTIIKNY